MSLPKYDDRCCTIGGYCVGAVAEFDPGTMHLKVGPGVFKLNQEMEEFVFPGAELGLPGDTIEALMMRDRETGAAAVGVRVASCGYVDDETCEPIERIVHLGQHGWRVVVWCPDRKNWQRQGKKAVPDPHVLVEEKLGQGYEALAQAVVFTEVPAHVQRVIELRQAAEQARDLDYLLEQATWTDADVEQMVRGLAARMRQVEAALGSG
jgi:hypothetical protein